MGENRKAAPELMVLLRSAADSTDNEWLSRKVAEWAANRIEALESSHADLLEAAQELLGLRSMGHDGAQSVGVVKAAEKLQEAINRATEVK